MTDFINLSAIGFAQLGTDNYYATKQVEIKVLNMFLQTDQFTIPEEFKGMCWVGVKRFPYEYDAYYEAVLYYDRDLLEDWEEQFNTLYNQLGIADMEPEKAIAVLGALSNKHGRFWDFANGLESIDFETKELMQQCHEIYAKEYPAPKEKPVKMIPGVMKVIHKTKNTNSKSG